MIKASIGKPMPLRSRRGIDPSARAAVEAIDPKAKAVGERDRLRLACAAAADLLTVLEHNGLAYPSDGACLRARLIDAGVIKGGVRMRRKRTIKQQLIEEAQARLAQARAKNDADRLAMVDSKQCTTCEGEGWRMIGEPTVCAPCSGTGRVPARVVIEVVVGGVVARGHHANISFMAALASSKACYDAVAQCIPRGIILRASDVVQEWESASPITALWWDQAEPLVVKDWRDMRGER